MCIVCLRGSVSTAGAAGERECLKGARLTHIWSVMEMITPNDQP